MTAATAPSPAARAKAEHDAYDRAYRKHLLGVPGVSRPCGRCRPERLCPVGRHLEQNADAAGERWTIAERRERARAGG